MLLSAFKQTLSELDKLKFQLPNGQALDNTNNNNAPK